MKALHKGPVGFSFAAIHILAQLCKYILMEDTDVQKTADLLKALGEFNRLSLVYNLCECKVPQNAMCLCKCCSVDASVASRHLKLLAQNDVVKVERKDRDKIYSLNASHIARDLRKLADKIEGKPSKTFIEGT